MYAFPTYLNRSHFSLFQFPVRELTRLVEPVNSGSGSVTYFLCDGYGFGFSSPKHRVRTDPKTKGCSHMMSAIKEGGVTPPLTRLGGGLNKFRFC